MAGYTAHMTCRLCKSRDEYISAPRHGVCDECLEPMAYWLCIKSLGPQKKGLDTPGIDRSYFMGEAHAVAHTLLGRWKPA